MSDLTLKEIQTAETFHLTPTPETKKAIDEIVSSKSDPQDKRTTRDGIDEYLECRKTKGVNACYDGSYQSQSGTDLSHMMWGGFGFLRIPGNNISNSGDLNPFASATRLTPDYLTPEQNQETAFKLGGATVLFSLPALDLKLTEKLFESVEGDTFSLGLASMRELPTASAASELSLRVALQSGAKLDAPALTFALSADALSLISSSAQASYLGTAQDTIQRDCEKIGSGDFNDETLPETGTCNNDELVNFSSIPNRISGALQASIATNSAYNFTNRLGANSNSTLGLIGGAGLVVTNALIQSAVRTANPDAQWSFFPRPPLTQVEAPSFGETFALQSLYGGLGVGVAALYDTHSAIGALSAIRDIHRAIPRAQSNLALSSNVQSGFFNGAMLAADNITGSYTALSNGYLDMACFDQPGTTSLKCGSVVAMRAAAYLLEAGAIFAAPSRTILYYETDSNGNDVTSETSDKQTAAALTFMGLRMGAYGAGALLYRLMDGKDDLKALEILKTVTPIAGDGMVGAGITLPLP